MLPCLSPWLLMEQPHAGKQSRTCLNNALLKSGMGFLLSMQENFSMFTEKLLFMPYASEKLTQAYFRWPQEFVFNVCSELHLGNSRESAIREILDRFLHALSTVVAWHCLEGEILCVVCPTSAMQSVSGLSSGKRSVGSSKALTSCTNSEPREVFNDCAALLPKIRGIDCRKYDEKHENHVLYKIRNRKRIPFHWENIQLQSCSIQCQIILWHYFSVTCYSGQFSLGHN